MKTIEAKLIYISCFILIFSLSACIGNVSLNTPYEGFTPGNKNDGWEISTPELENMDPLQVDKLFLNANDDVKYPTIRSLLIVRNGKLVGECYFRNPGHGDQLNNTMSVTKSITSILTGIAIDLKLIDSLDATVYNYLAPYFDDDPIKRSITIRQTLTMETGLDFDNEKHTSILLSGKGHSLTYVLGKDLKFIPGTGWYYGDGNPQLLSGIIQQTSGKSLAEFGEIYLFRPLGIKNYLWEKHTDGTNFGAVGLWLLSRDMAKIGLLMANKGRWNEKTIVSEEWVKTSTIKQAKNQNYGYYWYPIENKAFYAEGQGGQLIWVYPAKNLVVVITSDPYTKAWNLSSGYEELFSGLIESLTD